MTAPSEPQRRLEELLEDLLVRVGALEEAGRSPQLGRASLDDGFISVRAKDGTTLQTWGQNPDGTAGTRSFNKIPPPAPTTPTLTPLIAGLDVGWGGQLVGNMPGDFLCVRIHASPVPGFIENDSNHVATLYEAGTFPVSDLDYVPHYVKLVAVNLAGATSMASLVASATPKKVVADEVLDGVVHDLALAEDAVTAAKIAAGAVTGTKIAEAAISTPKIVAGAVQAEKIAAGAVHAEKIAANAVTAAKIAALAVNAEKIAANAVTAAKIAAGSITADKLQSDLVLSKRIIAGAPTGTRIELSASGLMVVKGDEVTFQVDAATGDVTSMGEYYTSRYGERIAMNSGAIQSPTIRAYPRRGNRYADLRSWTNTPGSTDLANWEIRLPYLSPFGGNFDLCMYNANFTPIASTRLRYGLRTNSSGILQPALEATGQDAGLVWFNGTVFVTNVDNTARRDIQVRNARVEAYMFFVGQNVQMKGFNNSIRCINGTDTAEVDLWCSRVVQTASERFLKNPVRSLDGALDTVRQWCAGTWTWKDADTRGTDEHTGLYVDEIADTAPDAVIPRDDGTRTYDDRAVAAYLVAAVQELAARLERLEQVVTQRPTKEATS